MGLHCQDLQTKGSDYEDWPAMAAVVGTNSTVSETNERYEPDNGTCRVVRAQRPLKNLTNGFSSQPYGWDAAETRTESATPSASTNRIA